MQLSIVKQPSIRSHRIIRIHRVSLTEAKFLYISPMFIENGRRIGNIICRHAPRKGRIIYVPKMKVPTDGDMDGRHCQASSAYPQIKSLSKENNQRQ